MTYKNVITHYHNVVLKSLSKWKENNYEDMKMFLP